MNRLWVRLTIAYVLVNLLSVVVVAALINWRADFQFRGFLMHRQMLVQSQVADDLAAYFGSNGNWDGVSRILPRAFGMMRGMGMMHGGPSTLLADAQGRVVYDDRQLRVGSALSADERANALPIVVNGSPVGFLTLDSAASLAPADEVFLNELRGTLGIAALFASVLGIVLALVVSRTLTAPLAELTQAARAFAERDWSFRVRARGTDEFTMVAQEFNSMADAIQRAEDLRRNMMADISHELRTPLSVMQGNLGAMLDQVYPIDHTEIAKLYDETRLLAHLVDDLHELALGDAGQLKLHAQDVDLGAIARVAVENFSLAVEGQNIRLDVEHSSANARGDPNRIVQVLRNLIVNALRYTPSGGRVTVSVTQDDKFARVSVADTGAGIAPEDLPRVFDRFHRGDRSRARTSGGSGLGLAIAKSLVEAMGGRIGVESKPGAGSVFWFTLPSK